jgi:hypothetical protein
VKTTASIIIILLLGLAGYMTWSIWDSNRPVGDIQLHIPNEADELLFITDPGAFSSGLKSLGDSSSAWPSSGIFGQVIDVIPEWTNAFDDASVHPTYCFSRIGENWLFISANQDQGYKDFLSTASDLAPSLKWQKNSKVWQCVDRPFLGAISEGLLIISNDANVLESSTRIAQKHKNFQKAFEERGKSSFANWLTRTENDSTWFCLDLAVKGQKILLNGYLPQQNPGLQSAIERDAKLPVIRSRKLYLHIPIADSESLWKSNERYYRSVDSLDFFNRTVSEYESSGNMDLKTAMTSWPSGEMQVQLFKGHEIVLIGHQSLINAKSHLLALCDSSKSIHLNREIYPLKVSMRSDLMLNPELKGELKFLCIEDDFVIMSDAESAITYFLDEWMLDQLGSLEEIIPGSAYLQRTSSLLTMDARSVQSLLPDEFNNYFGTGNDGAKCINLINENDNRTLLNAHIGGSFNPSVGKVNQESWKLALDETFTRKPELFTNHYSGEKEILIQDNSNQLYLISASGKILWKASIDGAIIGDIIPVDIFKNGKLQMVFNTSSKLYALDRNGNALDGFPVKIEEASSALSVFDYDNDRDYRFLLGLKNGDVLNIGTDGKQVKGWKYKNNGGAIASLKHFKIGSRDYILSLSESGKIELLKRNGNVREAVSANAENWLSNEYSIYLGNTLSESGIYIATKNNEIKKIPFKGSSTTILELDENIDHINIGQFSGDEAQEYIVCTGNSLAVYENGGELIWRKEFESKCELPAVYRFGRSDNRIGIQVGDQIWLLDNKGKASKGFPINGTTPLTIGDLLRNGELHMIYGKAGHFLFDQRIQ